MDLSYLEPAFLATFAAVPLAPVPMVVGGISCTAQITAHALGVLAAAPGLMIRQPLQRARNILARCDYHAVAAPYRDQFAALPCPGRRGAGGRPIAKEAFCVALGSLLIGIAEDPLSAWEALSATAWAAFSSDPGYAAQLAAAGAAVRQRSPVLVAA